MTSRQGYRIPSDTCCFSPVQFHPRAAARLAFGSVAQCVAARILPWPRLIAEYGWSFVAVGFELQYRSSLTFEKAGAWIEIGGELLLRGGGSLVEHRCTLRGDATDPGIEPPAPPIVVTTLWRPVRLTGTSELAGLPQPADEWLAGHFSADARSESKPERTLPRELSRLIESPLLAEHDHVLTVTRDECEIADQWQFVSLAGYIASSRETLVLQSTEPRIRGALRRPISRLVAELNGPLYFASRLRIRTRAVQLDGQLAFVHEGFDQSFTQLERPSFAAIEWFNETQETEGSP
jgi:hypothetical protein